jgi:hypothetical protein
VDWISDHSVELLHACTVLESCKKLLEHCQTVFTHLILESADFTSLEHTVLKSLLEREELSMDEIKIWEKVIAWGTAQLPGLSSDSQNWVKDDFIKLKDVVEELVPLIRFVGISSVDFCYKVMPYKRIFPKDLFKEVLCFYLDPNYMAETGKLPRPRQSKLVDQQHVEWILKQIKHVSQEEIQKN